MIRILLVDDQKLIRQGLKALLEIDPDLQVVGTASNGQTAIEQLETLHPDIALVDINMPGMDGVTTTQIITQRFTNTKVIVLSGHDDEEYLINALRSGAKGYLLKDMPAEELINGIRSVHQGYVQLGPGLVEKITFRMMGACSTNPTPISSSSHLLKQLEFEVENQLDCFNPKALLELVRLINQKKAAPDLLNYINILLESNPNNLTVLYLAGALRTPSDRENQYIALHYLKLGFKQGVKQKLTSDELLLFYQVGLILEPDEAFSWLTQEDGPWNNEEGLFFLLQEASRLFGNASVKYRKLLALKQTRTLRALSDRYVALSERVEFLNQSSKLTNSSLFIFENGKRFN